MDVNKEFFAGKKVLVMGLGRFGGGADAAKFVHSAGAKVTITDSAAAEKLSDSIKQLEEFGDIEYHLGGHKRSDFEQTDIIIVNPAVGPDNELLKLAHRSNKFVTSQINIFFELCPAPIIGITGSNGKSTTAALTAHLLRNTRYEIQDTRYENVWLSGNIGNEPLLVLIGRIRAEDLVVLELSSFQLEQLAQIQKAPKVAVLTNLTPNHLDRHGTFADYCAAKENIFEFQNCDEKCPAVSIFGAEDKIGCEWFEKYRTDKGRMCIKFSVEDIGEEIRRQFPLPGRVNLCNLAAAMTVARYLGIDDEQIKNCLAGFEPLPHRLELVAQIDGVCWYNDSIATTPESTIGALEAFEQPKIIIAGGYDKNLPFDELGQRIAQEAKAVVLIGQTAEKIACAVRKYHKSEVKIEFADSLTEAVEKARRLAVNGDVVLLSPGCASYDMFDNFQERGHQFIKLVRRLNCRL